MTLSTSVIDPQKRRMKRTAVTGGLLGLLCGVFTVIYEQFSHGAFSVHMRCMLLFPLVGCGLWGLICYLTPLWSCVDRWAFNFWNTAMATFTLGCLFRGIVNISGRFTKTDRVYLIVGLLLILISVTFEVIHLIRKRR